MSPCALVFSSGRPECNAVSIATCRHSVMTRDPPRLPGTRKHLDPCLSGGPHCRVLLSVPFLQHQKANHLASAHTTVQPSRPVQYTTVLLHGTDERSKVSPVEEAAFCRSHASALLHSHTVHHLLGERRTQLGAITDTLMTELSAGYLSMHKLLKSSQSTLIQEPNPNDPTAWIQRSSHVISANTFNGIMLTHYQANEERGVTNNVVCL
ncbi:hypothetical protein EXN66_Car009318 [Channa argus]|uniref:Uncharacterized protein n=1 Tax=Channa argus TaxID=215402 RepID=A0A6G1PTQ1_CHAAH|nr:hypothetical protein EXN66_Car009318 [Channa argus]